MTTSFAPRIVRFARASKFVPFLAVLTACTNVLGIDDKHFDRSPETPGGGSGGCDSACNGGPSRLSAGWQHACALRGDGAVLCWGDNFNGELGRSGIDYSPEPLEVEGLTGVTELAAGNSYHCALLGNGTVRCWGRLVLGEADQGSLTIHETPSEVPNLTRATKIAGHGTGNFTCALFGDGEVACWGLLYSTEYQPVAISVGVSGAVDLAVGGSHACAVLADGTAECWGANSTGQLGNGTVSLEISPPAPVRGLRNVAQLALGSGHGCARLENGTIFCWGMGTAMELGDGVVHDEPRTTPALVPGIDDAVFLAAGYEHTCAARSDGTATCWGRGDDGQLGDGILRTVAPGASAPVTVRLDSVRELAGGFFHTCARCADDSVWCWGHSYHGMLGEDVESGRGNAIRPTPLRVPGFP